MADPVSLALVGSAVLTEGIKFLYGQASKILERRAARKEAEKKASAEAATSKTEPAQVQLPAVFQGQLSSPEVDFDEVERQFQALRVLRGRLLDYADGIVSVDPEDQHLIADVDSLRQVLESIYGQRITFKGEDREPSGVKVITKAKVDVIAGHFTGTNIEDAEKGEFNTELDIKEIKDGADVIGTNYKKSHS